MERRSFLQLSGMSFAASMLAGCQKGNEKLIPYLVPAEEGAKPGAASDFASTCRQCPAGCGILVRISEGRAKKIEGNPQHPVNRGKLCARGQAVLQELYHPDRLKQPLKRTGPRGSGEYTPISWDEALQQLSTDLAPFRQPDNNGLLLFTTPMNGSLSTLCKTFLEHFPNSQQLAWDIMHPEWLQQGLYGDIGVPDYDLENTQYLLSFGANFLENHLSPVHDAYGFGRMRQARPTIRGRFSYIGPRLSMTAASADRWLPARPGTEWALALGIAHELIDRGQQDITSITAAGLDSAEITDLVADFNVARVAEITGVNPEDIRSTINEAVTISPTLAVVGEMVAWQSNGAAAIASVELLNLLLGNVNRPGGSYYHAPTSEQTVSSFSELHKLVQQMEQGQIGLVLLHASNPVFSLPENSGFQRAFSKVPRIVSFSSFLDESSLQADLILPDHSNLESWGDVIPPAGVRSEVIGLMQPVVKPLHDTRAFADVLLAAAKAFGGQLAEDLPQESYRAWLETDLARRLPELSSSNRQTQLDHLFQHGGWFGDKTQIRKPGSLKLPHLPPDPTFIGTAAEFPLKLQIYPSPLLYDGRSSHLPWLQQLPEPMTTAVWGSWLEINPQIAQKLGIAQGDLVEVRSPAGRVEVPAVLYPGLHPEVVACPIGQGHQGMGRYAEKRGINPLQLIELPEASSQSPPAWGATRVQLRKVADHSELVTAGHAAGSYRHELLGL